MSADRRRCCDAFVLFTVRDCSKRPVVRSVNRPSGSAVCRKLTSRRRLQLFGRHTGSLFVVAFGGWNFGCAERTDDVRRVASRCVICNFSRSGRYLKMTRSSRSVDCVVCRKITAVDGSVLTRMALLRVISVCVVHKTRVTC